ncbi:MAG: endonuclease V [Thermoplasmata archaeon]
MPDLWKATYDLVAQVPRGRVTTYGEVAKALGDIVASRFVGLAMSRNDDLARVHCSRVVQSDGHVGGYTGGGPRRKIRILREEGIKIVGSRILDLDEVLFKDFETTYPLKDLRRRQRALKKHLRLAGFKNEVERLAGIDIAYDGDHGYAAMVTYDYASGKEVDRTVVEGDAEFPYIPTFLAFREIPVIEPLMEHVDENTIVMFDGNGILHPEGFGVTSQIGVVFDVPTIGVAKKLLCGEVRVTRQRNMQQVFWDGELRGSALRNDAASNPVYVSPGNIVSQDQALAITKKFMKFRVPEPTRVAHIVAEEARRGKSHK